MSLLKDLRLKGRILYDEPLYKHTSFRIGGPVRIWAEPIDMDDISGLLEISRVERLPLFVIGEGSNFLISDKGLDMIAISLKDSFGLFKIGERLSVQAGYGLQRFILNTIDAGYSGLEFMAGIPGTIGGAIRMNAGAGLNGPWISDFIDKIKVSDYTGRVRDIGKKDLKFGYRYSGLGDFIILEAEFVLEESKQRETSKQRYKKFLTEKKKKQELSIASAGCIFKNPKGSKSSAAQLIEGCGLKQKRVGGALVSEKHANFIVNLGKATFKDVMKLIELIRSEVLKRYNIALETEVEILK